MEENGLDPAHIPIARLGIAPKIKVSKQKFKKFIILMRILKF